MEESLPKLKKQTPVDNFISRFEEMILSGKLSIGEKLPSERDLAVKLGVSRPVVHEGLIDLSIKGLITRTPTCASMLSVLRGYLVQDFVSSFRVQPRVKSNKLG